MCRHWVASPYASQDQAATLHISMGAANGSQVTQSQDKGFYRSHGVWTDPGAMRDGLSAIPGTARDICAAIQGVLIHDHFGAHLYDARPAGFDGASRSTRTVADRVRMIRLRDPAPLTQRRSPAARSVGTCRDFALLACALLRHHGRPARVRCGFAGYFHPPTYEDHWVCQVWEEDGARWVTVDAQLDPEHIAHLSIAFDPCDIPADAFLFPWQVWQRWRARPERFSQFGHGEASGAKFVHVNLARDFLALRKSEVSLWDTWREQDYTDAPLTVQAQTLCDDLSEVSAALDQGSGVRAARLQDLSARVETPPWRQAG